MLSVVIWEEGEVEPVESDWLRQKISGQWTTKATPSQ